jgi:hypothetical protein
MDTIPAIIIGICLIIYGLFVYKRKMLWILNRTTNDLKMKRTYGIIFIIIGIIVLVIGCILYSKGIITTKNNNLY